MPNHVENDLTVKGDMNEIRRFFEKVKGGREDVLIDANKLIPYPKVFEDKDCDDRLEGLNSGGYDWRVANWGTKWGMYSFEKLVFRKKTAKVTFSTAWSPPLPLVLKMSEMYPNLKFSLKYYECGMGFCGRYEAKAGVVMLDRTEDYRGNRGG